MVSDHSSEGRYLVEGYEGAGEYAFYLQYLDKDGNPVDINQIIAYVDASNQCKQFIR